MTARLSPGPADLEKRALARLLRVDPADIAYLDAVPAAELRALRLRVLATVSKANAAGLRRIASVSALLPPAVAAHAAARGRGGLFAARMACAMDTSRAAEVGRRLPVPVLADIAVELDPTTRAVITTSLPDKALGQVVAELSTRAQWLTLAEFAEQDFSAAQLDVVLASLSPGALLATGSLIYRREPRARLVRGLSAAGVDRLIDYAARHDLWPELLNLVDALADEIGAHAVRTARNLQRARRLRATDAIADHGLPDRFGLFDATAEEHT